MSELKITQEKVTAAFSEANDCPKAIPREDQFGAQA